ncbi:MAG: hypothetical protein JNK05_24850 [Myxococcales bacterium]|nr:hypothetical protein [Myxococcales bacterium]
MTGCFDVDARTGRARAWCRTVACAVALALSGCGASLSPTDPLVGVWRSGEFEGLDPFGTSRPRTVIEWRFDDSGHAELFIVRRYDLAATSMLRGCTWTERRTQLRWARAERPSTRFSIVAVRDARYTSERTGCADPGQNRAQTSFPDDFGSEGWQSFSAVVREPTMELTAWGPVGVTPDVRGYSRVR